MILAYVGGFDPAYPRNAVLRAGLARLGVDVKSLFVSGGGVLGRGSEIVRRLGALHPRPDVVLVAEFCHKDVPAAWLGARRIGALCASDPMCAEHVPTLDNSLHAAACHACAFLPETSCERGNKYLDRSVLVKTVDRDDLAFFE